MPTHSAAPASYSADSQPTLTSGGAPPAASSTSAPFPSVMPPTSAPPTTAGHVAASKTEEPRDAPKGSDPTSLVHHLDKQGPEAGVQTPSGVEIKQKRDPTLPKPPKKTGTTKKPKQKGNSSLLPRQTLNGLMVDLGEPVEDGVGYRLPSHPPGSAPYPRPGSGIPPPPVPPSLSMSASSSANFGGSGPGTAQPSRPPSASTKPQQPPSRPSYPMEVGESPVYLASQMPDAYPSYSFPTNFSQQNPLPQASLQNQQNPPQHVSYAPLSMPAQPSPLPPLATTPYYPPGPPSAKPVYPPFPPFSTTPVTTTPTYPPFLKPASSGTAGPVPHEATKREKVHLSVIDRLYRIENDFLERKDALYEQKALELRRELQEIQRSVHPQFMDKARELETQYNTALRETKDQKKYLDACLERAAISDRELAKKELEVGHCSLEKERVDLLK